MNNEYLTNDLLENLVPILHATTLIVRDILLLFAKILSFQFPFVNQGEGHNVGPHKKLMFF